MKWNKKGRIQIDEYEGKGVAARFATLPTPILMSEKVIRIFVGFCDEKNVGRVGYVDVSAENPSCVLNVSEKVALDIGRAGCFDDNGVVPLSVMRKGRDIYLYYVGFQLGVKVPYFMFGGLAISKNSGESFERFSETPILDRKDDEVFARCGMNVMRDSNCYKMWYIGTTRGVDAK